jgi:PEP-CTERM motif-containing protein
MSIKKIVPFAFALVASTFSFPAATMAVSVWSSGPGDVTFSKPSWNGTAGAAGDPALAANQDRITDLVWLTRGQSKALYNAKTETAFNDVVDPAISPADTEWAFSALGGNPTFAYGTGAAMHGSLTFDHFEDSLGGTLELRSNVVLSAGVVHLITDDIYIDIKFSNWQSGGGGAFTETRAVAPVPEPATFGLFAFGGALMWQFRRTVTRSFC